MNPPVAQMKYICEMCCQEFESDWPDEEAKAEYEAEFPGYRNAAISIVCEDCYRIILAEWKKR